MTMPMLGLQSDLGAQKSASEYSVHKDQPPFYNKDTILYTKLVEQNLVTLMTELLLHRYSYFPSFHLLP